MTLSMIKSYSNLILKRIRGKRRGWVFIAKDFIDLASRNTIDQILYRLVKQGIIRKLKRGVYDFPIIHHKLGSITPSLDTLAQTLANQTNDSIQPSGATAANRLGLDTQVPAKTTYITSGHSKQKQIAGYTIRLKHSKLLAQLDAVPNLKPVVLALYHLGKNHIDNSVINKLTRSLTVKDKSDLFKLISKIPQWMVPFIFKITGKQYGNIS